MRDFIKIFVPIIIAGILTLGVLTPYVADATQDVSIAGIMRNL